MMRPRALFGIFIKTPAHQVVEAIAPAKPDFVVIDAEHAPFERGDLDRMLLAAKYSGIRALVRVADHTPSMCGACLDMGAAGILAPRVANADQARALVAATRFYRGSRGFSPSVRAGNYGSCDPMVFAEQSDAQTQLWCQIECRPGLDAAEDIAGVPGVDCLFIGPADLAMSLGCTSGSDPAVLEAITRILDAGKAQGKRVGIFSSKLEDAREFLHSGMDIVILGSDQHLLRMGVSQIREALASNLSE